MRMEMRSLCGSCSSLLRPCTLSAVHPSSDTLLRRGTYASRSVLPQPARSRPGSAAYSVTAAEEQEVVEVGWLWDRKASGTKTRLAQNKLKPKRSLGQNFVTDDNVLRAIAAAPGLRKGDPVLEIGPGTGNLTKCLLLAEAQVTAVEKDDALYAQLLQDFQKAENFYLMHGDVLRIDLGKVVKDMVERTSTASSDHPARAVVVANLPYNITKACLRKLLPMSDSISDLYIMLQDEVAKRLCNPADGHEYRAMNVEVQYYAHLRYKFQIDRKCYHPVPGVHGGLVHFRLKPPEQRVSVPSAAGFLTMVRLSFSSKRKMIRNSLQQLYTPDEVAAALSTLGLKPEARAQELQLEQFAQLYTCLEQQARR